MIVNRNIFQLSRNNVKFFATQVNIKEAIANHNTEWETAQPYKNIPGPTIPQLILGFAPGGKFHNKSRSYFNTCCQLEYGNIIRIPGVFRRRDVLLSYDPNHFELIYRTEGVWPKRVSLETLNYYRQFVNPECFKCGDLITSHGEIWGKLRSKVNPVMMQPKTIRMYVPRMDGVTSQLIQKIRDIRDPVTNEVPGTFEKELNYWALESVALVGLDTNLGIINDKRNNPDALKLIEALDVVFKLPIELDMKPSLWKLFATPNYKKLMAAFDSLTEISIKYINEAIKRIESSPNIDQDDSERSVIERLIKIDKNIAVVMALEMFFAGIDTTTTALTGCLLALAKNPEKQEKLRCELMKVLPNKDTVMTETKLNQVPYLRCVLKESLRLYPVVAENSRATGQDLVLNGYRVPKDTDVMIQTADVCQSEIHFPQSDKYVPERWIRDQNETQQSTDAVCPMGNNIATKASNPFVYLPFGFGTRMCIGKRIVEMELEIALAKIIRNFHVEFNHPEEDVFSLHLIYTPNKELRFRFVDLEN